MPDDSTPPPSLKPLSPSCLVPFGILFAVCAAAFMGIRSIERNTGPWSILAAKKGIAESGLPELDRAALTLQLERLNAAFEAEKIPTQDLVSGVDAILKEPLIGELVLEDARVRRIPASGLTDDEKVEADAALATVLSYSHVTLIEPVTLYKVLGALNEVGTDGVPAVLDDGQLRELVGRAKLAIKNVTTEEINNANAGPATRAVLLADLSERVDGIVGAE